MARIDKAEVLRYLGYSGQSIDANLDARIDEAIGLCRKTCAPRRLWRAFELEPFDEECPRIVAGTVLRLEGTSMERYLAGAAGVVLLACTLGASCERQLRLLAAVDPMGQLLYDAACSALVESEADACSEAVLEWARSKGLACGSRYSPGYGDFPLEVQGLLLTTLNASSTLGIHTTDDGLLIPTKSVTAVIGLFESTAPPVPLGCVTCSLFGSCGFRQRGTQCHRKPQQ